MNNRDGFPEDRRKELRSLDYVPIEFIIGEKGTEILKGFIVNLGGGVMTIFSYVPMAKGQKIKIISPLDIPHQNFVVQWINKYLDDFFMVGLKNV
jgi:hypothetical protein